MTAYRYELRRGVQDDRTHRSIAPLLKRELAVTALIEKLTPSGRCTMNWG